jgi:hypothetical protein
MDARRFDAIAKSLAVGLARRTVLRGIGAGAAAALLGRGAAADLQAAGSLPPGARCTRNGECQARVCLDNGRCGCASLAAGTQVACPSGCRCEQVSPGGVFACIVAVNFPQSCLSECTAATCHALPRCTSNAQCGPKAFCNQSVCEAGRCIRRCGT